MTMPPVRVLIHKKALYSHIKAPEGNYFGHHNTLTTILYDIETGYCGNKKREEDCTPKGYMKPDFAREKSNHRISFQQHGGSEEFSGGHLSATNPTMKPRWFQSGETVCPIKERFHNCKLLLYGANSPP